MKNRSQYAGVGKVLLYRSDNLCSTLCVCKLNAGGACKITKLKWIGAMTVVRDMLEL